MNLKAAIDIGSNSILLFVAEVTKDGAYKEVHDEAHVTGLGKGIDKSSMFAEESMSVSRDTLLHYAKVVTDLGIDPSEVIVTATEASRVAKNAPGFFQEIYEATKLKVTTITGEGEAFYTTLGVTGGSATAQDSMVIMDIGGASTELIRVNNSAGKGVIENLVSLPIGSVRATDWLTHSHEYFLEQIDKIMNKDYELGGFKAAHLTCVAGTMTSLGAMIKGLDEYKSKIVHTMHFTKKDFDKLVHSLESLSEEAILKKFPFLGKRAKSIYGGALAANLIASKLEVKDFEISTYGLRHGVVFSGGLNAKYISGKNSA